ncbi:Protein of uncharacterised function (DUF2929) [Staphylococcus petrasii]|uniref:DUF2929 family protein n=1 Tax=Staphylococcus petrasii TaxID=1276936 RepID=A0A380G2I2_9STAP|nr:YjzD family protein [Staphylococcus petrasii]PNZ30717.1 DUF2929 domain-containing protein [Staphylococcus petrasii]TGE11625.1 DUF2929 family protein [Staphylococcus petrasii]TGE17705.1 DUF2929 family protein [Staphylococcus petrasii]SUM44707.1 Protein of uncharacterised function (DUF2929) [Staphylococcus petrasii]
MKHLITFIWALILMQMVNFVLNSLNGGGSLNFIAPVIIAVFITIMIAILGAMIKPNDYARKGNRHI